MNKNNRLLIAVGIIIIGLLAFIAIKKPSSSTPITPSPEIPPSTYQTPAVTQPVISTTLQVKKTIPKTTAPSFIASNDDPYTHESRLVGGAAYFLLKEPITVDWGSTDKTAKGYPLYTNDAGGYKTSDNKIYYDSTPMKFDVDFGEKVTKQGTTADFIAAANLKIAQNGYAIIAWYLDGGIYYQYFSVVQ